MVKPGIMGTPTYTLNTHTHILVLGGPSIADFLLPDINLHHILNLILTRHRTTTGSGKQTEHQFCLHSEGLQFSSKGPGDEKKMTKDTK